MSVRALRRGSIAASRVQVTTATAFDLPGTSGNYASTPDSASLDTLVSDIDIRARVAMDDWTPASTSWIVVRSDASPSLGWAFGVLATGSLRLGISANGTSNTFAASSVATGFTDGTSNWVRVTWRNSDDRTQFFTSADGSSWTQLGTDVTLSATGIFQNNRGATVGAFGDGSTSMLAGVVRYVEIRNGIDGTVVAKFDPSAVTIVGTRNPTSFVAPTTGETWTMTGSAWNWVTV